MFPAALCCQPVHKVVVYWFGYLVAVCPNTYTARGHINVTGLRVMAGVNGVPAKVHFSNAFPSWVSRKQCKRERSLANSVPNYLRVRPTFHKKVCYHLLCTIHLPYCGREVRRADIMKSSAAKVKDNVEAITGAMPLQATCRNRTYNLCRAPRPSKSPSGRLSSPCDLRDLGTSTQA